MTRRVARDNRQNCCLCKVWDFSSSPTKKLFCGYSIFSRNDRHIVILWLLSFWVER